MPKNLTTDAEKAAHMLKAATGDAPLICEARVGQLSPVELACLAHAYDDGQSVNFAHEVIHYAATRQRMEEIAAARSTKQGEDETVLVPVSE